MPELSSFFFIFPFFSAENADLKSMETNLKAVDGLKNAAAIQLMDLVMKTNRKGKKNTKARRDQKNRNSWSMQIRRQSKAD